MESMLNRSNYIGNSLYIFSLIILLANDFYFKATYPNIVTGKLSDFSGLVVFYGFVCFLFGPNKKIVWGIALSFIYWKSGFSQTLIDLFNDMAPFRISRVIDYSDLIALVVLPIYQRYLQIHRRWEGSKAVILIVLPITVFGISATSVVDPIIAERYDKYVSRYDYSDSEMIYKVNLPLESLISRFRAYNYTVSDSYYIQPWDGTVYSFTPLDRCTRHAVLQEKGIKNRKFDTVQVQLKEIGSETEIRLYSLTLCYELKPLEQAEAVSFFEKNFLP